MSRSAIFAAAAVAFAVVASSPAAGASSDAGDLVVLDAGPAQVSLYGLLHLEIAPYTGDENLRVDGDPAEDPGFRTRRARFGAYGWAWGTVEYGLSLDLAGADATLLDAFVSYGASPLARVYVGTRKVPFSRLALFGSERGTLAERPLSTRAMAPFRQLGLTVEGEVGGLLHYAAGIYDRFDRHPNFHEGYTQNANAEGNVFGGLAYAGRLSLEPLGAVGPDLADLDGGGVRVGLGGAYFYDDGRSSRIHGWEADLVAKLHGAHLIAEVIFDRAEAKVSPTTDSDPGPLKRMGFTAEVGYVLRPIPLGLAFRAERIDDDRAVDDDGDEIVLAGGVQYYWRRHHLKATLDYTHRIERIDGFDRDNDTLLLSVMFAL